VRDGDSAGNKLASTVDIPLYHPANAHNQVGDSAAPMLMGRAASCELSSSHPELSFNPHMPRLSRWSAPQQRVAADRRGCTQRLPYGGADAYIVAESTHMADLPE
jgi:hypothetical protein